MTKTVRGTVVDWKVKASRSGIILSAQVPRSVEEFLAGDETLVQMGLNDHQLKSLIIDLVRASLVRGIVFGSPKKWWKFR